MRGLDAAECQLLEDMLSRSVGSCGPWCVDGRCDMTRAQEDAAYRLLRRGLLVDMRRCDYDGGRHVGPAASARTALLATRAVRGTTVPA